jgi:hypothetical protein
MQTLITKPKHRHKTGHQVSSSIKRVREQCVEDRYLLEPEFRTMIDSIKCAKYVLNKKHPAFYLIVRIKGEKEDKAYEARLQNILNEITALEDNENVEGYIFKPTDHAVRTAKFYIEKIYSKMGESFPRPSFIPDGEGGIDIEWSVGRNELTLSCRAKTEQEDFLYVKKGDIRYTELDLSSTKIYKQLKELNNA